MSKIGKAGLATVAGAAGAAAAYAFDPERGRARRAQARDQIFSRFRKAQEGFGKQASYAAGTATAPATPSNSGAAAEQPAPPMTATPPIEAGALEDAGVPLDGGTSFDAGVPANGL